MVDLLVSTAGLSSLGFLLCVAALLCGSASGSVAGWGQSKRFSRLSPVRFVRVLQRDLFLPRSARVSALRHCLFREFWLSCTLRRDLTLILCLVHTENVVYR